jgi:formylglycine-generating enzyme required for sulfatase activity
MAAYNNKHGKINQQALRGACWLALSAVQDASTRKDGSCRTRYAWQGVVLGLSWVTK